MTTQNSVSDAASQVSDSTITPDLYCFEDELSRRNVLDASSQDEYPDDWEEVNAVLRQDRASPEPTVQEHRAFYRRVSRTTNEASIMASVGRKLLKDEWNDELNISWQHDQAWNRSVLLHPSLRPRLPSPKPDQAIGWSPKAFSQYNAIKRLTLPSAGGRRTHKSYAAPSDGLHWPVFTVEGKGAAGELRKARQQNLHNAAIMVSNRLKLKAMNGTTEGFLGRVGAVTMELTAEVVQLNCHWARNVDGHIVFYGRILNSWSLYSPFPEVYAEAKRSIANTVDWMKQTTYREISRDLSVLEDKALPPLRTPPSSYEMGSQVSIRSDTSDSTPLTKSVPHEAVEHIIHKRRQSGHSASKLKTSTKRLRESVSEHDEQSGEMSSECEGRFNVQRIR